MSGTWRDTAQICLNGHVINAVTIQMPDYNKRFCDECGAPTISACVECSQPIEGYLHVPGVLGDFGYFAPKYCPHCGKPYPWTRSALQAAVELADFELSEEDAATIKENLNDIVQDTPRAKVAALRVRKILESAGPVARDTFKDILVGVLSETIRKTMFPGS